MNRIKYFVLAIALGVGMLVVLSVLPALAGVGESETTPSIPETFDPQLGGDHVEFVSQLGGAFQAVDVEGNYAYLAVGQRLMILDISNHAEPIFVGQTELLTGGAIKVLVSGNYAYLVDPGVSSGSGQRVGSRVHIIDISNKNSPKEVQVFPTPGTTGSFTEMALNNGYAYLGGYGAGFVIADFRDPLNPIQVKRYGSTSYYLTGDVVWLKDGKTYVVLTGDLVGSGGGARMEIIDVTDPLNPATRSIFPLNSSDPQVAVQGDIAYISDDFQLRIVNISNPASPSDLGATPPDEMYLSDILVQGNYVYVLGAGLGHIYDVSTPSSPTHAGSYSYGALDFDLTLSNGHIYNHLAEGNGYRIVDVTTPGATSSPGSYTGFGLASTVLASGNRLYVTDGAELRVLDISDPLKMTVLGGLIAEGKIRNIEGGKAFLAAEDRIIDWPTKVEGGLRVINITDTGHLTEAGFFQTPGSPLDMDLFGNFAYIADNDLGLTILGITDTAHITQTANFDTQGFAESVSVAESVTDPGKVYAYVADGDPGVQIIDVTDPTSPTLAGYYQPNGYSDEVLVEAIDTTNMPGITQTLIVVGYSNGYIHLVNVNDPSSPSTVGVYKLNYLPYEFEIQNGKLYVADGVSGVQILYLGVSAEYFGILGWYKYPEKVYDVAVAGDLIYLGTRENGFWSAWYGPGWQEYIPTSGGAFTSTFDSTSYFFPAGTYTTTVRANHHPRFSGNITIPLGQSGIGHFFEFSTYYKPSQPYQIKVQYTDDQISSVADESTLALYYWNGDSWVKEPSSTVDVDKNIVTAWPDHTSLWGVLGQGAPMKTIYLPITLKKP